MGYMGRNMDSLLRKVGGKFTLATFVNVSEQMLQRLESLHTK